MKAIGSGFLEGMSSGATAIEYGLIAGRHRPLPLLRRSKGSGVRRSTTCLTRSTLGSPKLAVTVGFKGGSLRGRAAAARPRKSTGRAHAARGLVFFKVEILCAGPEIPWQIKGLDHHYQALKTTILWPRSCTGSASRANTLPQRRPTQGPVPTGFSTGKFHKAHPQR